MFVNLITCATVIIVQMFIIVIIRYTLIKREGILETDIFFFSVGQYQKLNLII